jgi:hypothetical protein
VLSSGTSRNQFKFTWIQEFIPGSPSSPPQTEVPNHNAVADVDRIKNSMKVIDVICFRDAWRLVDEHNNSFIVRNSKTINKTPWILIERLNKSVCIITRLNDASCFPYFIVSLVNALEASNIIHTCC